MSVSVNTGAFPLRVCSHHIRVLCFFQVSRRIGKNRPKIICFGLRLLYFTIVYALCDGHKSAVGRLYEWKIEKNVCPIVLYGSVGTLFFKEAPRM